MNNDAFGGFINFHCNEMATKLMKNSNSHYFIFAPYAKRIRIMDRI